MKDKRNQIKQWSGGGYRLDLGIDFMEGQPPCGPGHPALGVVDQRDVTLLTSVLKFPGVLLCGFTSSQDSHKNWACLRPGNSPGIDFPPSLWKPFFLLLFGTISTISGLSQERGHLRDRTARNSFPVPQVWSPSAPLTPWS